MLHGIEPEPVSNKLLAALPRRDYQLLLPHLTTVQLAVGDVLYEAGVEVDQVYFPLSGMISMIVMMRDGKGIETGMVGREGVIEAMSGHGLHVTKVRSIAQLLTFASPALRKLVRSSKPIAELCIGYNEVLLGQARLTAACNALHHIEQRFCRWLLQIRDHAEKLEPTREVVYVPAINAVAVALARTAIHRHVLRSQSAAPCEAGCSAPRRGSFEGFLAKVLGLLRETISKGD